MMAPQSQKNSRHEVQHHDIFSPLSPMVKKSDSARRKIRRLGRRSQTVNKRRRKILHQQLEQEYPQYPTLYVLPQQQQEQKQKERPNSHPHQHQQEHKLPKLLLQPEREEEGSQRDFQFCPDCCDHVDRGCECGDVNCTVCPWNSSFVTATTSGETSNSASLDDSMPTVDSHCGTAMGAFLPPPPLSPHAHTHRLRKQVSFALIEDIITSSQEGYTDEEKTNLWYTKTDYREFHSAAKRFARSYNKAAKAEAAARALATSGNAEPPSRRHHVFQCVCFGRRDSKRNLLGKKKSKSNSCRSAKGKDSSGEDGCLRGLEAFLPNEVNRKDRVPIQALDVVMDTQERQHMERFMSDMTLNERGQEIADLYMQATRPSIARAHQVGLSDARDAKTIYAEAVEAMEEKEEIVEDLEWMDELRGI